MPSPLCIEQQAEVDVVAGDHFRGRLLVASVLGAPLVVLRDGQGASRPSQLRHPLFLR